jgi:hypothetical protein
MLQRDVLSMCSATYFSWVIHVIGNMLGTPIASAIVSASGGSYHWAIVFAGAVPMLGAFLLLAHRLSIEPRIFVKI